MRQPGIVLVEESPYESALAYLALTRNTPTVFQVRDLRAAARLASGGEVGLAILGPRALATVCDRQVQALGIPAVGIGVNQTEADVRRALAAGLRAVYRRPREWKGYLTLVGHVVAEWLVTRKDSAPRPARTS